MKFTCILWMPMALTVVIGRSISKGKPVGRDLQPDPTCASLGEDWVSVPNANCVGGVVCYDPAECTASCRFIPDCYCSEEPGPDFGALCAACPCCSVCPEPPPECYVVTCTCTPPDCCQTLFCDEECNSCGGNNPCTEEDIFGNPRFPGGQFYFPHCDPTKFVQCDAHGGCFDRPCAPGTGWSNDAYTCTQLP